MCVGFGAAASDPFPSFMNLLSLIEVSAEVSAHMPFLQLLFGFAFADTGVVISDVDAARLMMPVLQ